MSDFQHPAMLTEETYLAGITNLCAKDADLAGVVSNWGNPPFWTHTPGFPGIVTAILAQQISLESAYATFGKLEKAIGTINPEGFLSLDNGALRNIGFSRQKASYVKGIANEILGGGLRFDKLDAMDNDAARKYLMGFRGIGPWTADSYLLFSLRRPDVWPLGDFALEKAIQELKGLAAKPGPDAASKIAARWKPWRAVAARILWHAYLCERGRRISS